MTTQTKSKRIMKHLIENNSYFKWSKQRLAEKYGCSVKTVKDVLHKLQGIKNTYLQNLKG